MKKQKVQIEKNTMFQDSFDIYNKMTKSSLGVTLLKHRRQRSVQKGQTIDQLISNSDVSEDKTCMEQNQTLLKQYDKSKRNISLSQTIKEVLDFGIQMKSRILYDTSQLTLLFNENAKFSLIFRGSNYKFSSKQFHQRCDNIPNTLVVCKTQFNKIVGGFTPLIWNEEFLKNKTYFKSDSSNQTFLFSLDKMQKFYLKKKQNKAICCFKGFGPTFGGGYDLQIGNNTDMQPNTVSYFPSNYFNKYKQSDTPSRYEIFGTDNTEFKLIQYQVFFVTFFDGPTNIRQKRQPYRTAFKCKHQQEVTYSSPRPLSLSDNDD